MQDFRDGVVRTRDVGGLKVFVVGKGRGDGDYEIYRAATRGKVGGLGDGEGW